MDGILKIFKLLLNVLLIITAFMLSLANISD